MANRKYIYPNIFARQSKIRGNRTHILFYCRFVDWKGKRRTFALGDQFDQAKLKRDEYIRKNADRYDFDTKEGPVILFTAWAEKWLSLTERKRSHGRDVLVVQRCLAPFFGTMVVGDITELTVEEYKRSREQEVTRYGTPPSPATINRELACLRSIIIMVQGARQLADRFGRGTARPKIRLLKEPPRRDRTVTREEFEQLRACMIVPYDAILTVLWEVGARETETCLLQQSGVDLAQKTLTFTTVKTEERTIPISQVLVEILTAHCSPTRADDRLFPGVTRDRFWWAFRKARQKTGLFDIIPHDFRATFITRMLDAGHNPKSVAMITGSKDMRVLMKHYDRPSFASLRTVVDRPFGDTVATQ